MFSVNIDKIVGMTDNEKKCYEELRENLKKELKWRESPCYYKEWHRSI